MNKVKKNYADMDPIEEVRAVREKISREFPTVKAYCDYLRAKYPAANPPAPQEPLRKDRRSSEKVKARPNARPAMRQRKAAAHA